MYECERSCMDKTEVGKQKGEEAGKVGAEEGDCKRERSR
jgi:hypothetical protein